MKLSNLIRLAGSLLVCASLASAAPILFQRAMPTGAGVNNPNGALRSNVKWEPNSNGTTFLGDDFILNNNFVINQFSVWMVANEADTTNPNQEMSDIALYIGEDLSPNPSTVSFISNSYSFSPGPFSYFNDVRGINQPIFKITFDNLNFAGTGGVLYNFGILGTPVNPNFQLSLAASNAALSNSIQNGPDGYFLVFDSATGDLLGGYNSLLDGLWDKETDINVEIAGVPEPSTLSLLALGGAALVYFRRRQ